MNQEYIISIHTSLLLCEVPYKKYCNVLHKVASNSFAPLSLGPLEVSDGSLRCCDGSLPHFK